jgi:hypothetical protein
LRLLTARTSGFVGSLSAALFVVTVVQPALLPASLLGNAARWALFTVGWSVGIADRFAAPHCHHAILGANWVAACAVTLAREPSARILVSLGFLGACVVVVQAFAQVANAIITHAASAAQVEMEARLDLLTRQRVAAALSRISTALRRPEAQRDSTVDQAEPGQTCRCRASTAGESRTTANSDVLGSGLSF